jgi:hypothetical protein
MQHHRFTDQVAGRPREEAAPQAQGFVLCPLALQQGWQGAACPWQDVYRMAYAQAQAVVRPSLLERVQATNWN